MRISAVTFTSTQIKQPKMQYNTNPAPQKTDLIQPKNFIFDNWFKSVDMEPIESIKTKENNPRFNKKELKEIKSNIKAGNLTTNTVKYFSDTMLDVKSMAEAYKFAKNTKDSAKELSFIKDNVKKYEKDFKDMPDSIKLSLNTKFEQSKFENKNVYKITNCFDTKGGMYGENNQFYSSWEVSAGPYYPSSSRSENSNNKSNEKQGGVFSDLSNPLNPLSPLNPMYH